MPSNPTMHAIRAASTRTRWYWNDGHGGTRQRHKAACPCNLCQACRQAFVAGGRWVMRNMRIKQ